MIDRLLSQPDWMFYLVVAGMFVSGFSFIMWWSSR